ncbi:hypothetical protein ACH5RR_035968 [Cinchona calisaya]|uniref:Protein BIG GRAIN 1-like E n=1 Tax=Cinchona calisaya TaxID=153742 RepID=A0ABD2Y5E1_9GENT
MSIVGLPEPEKMFKKSHNRRNDSGEIDVFEAAKYFSGASEIYTYNNNAANFATKVIRDHQENKQSSRAGRFSLDVQTMRNNSISSQNLVMEKKQIMIKEKKLHKQQPSSPGGKLANFLNSLFSQTSSRNKKKSKSISTTTTQSSIKDDQDENSPGWRRKRRSSISHFRSDTNHHPIDATKSVYSTSRSSGFRTPPPYNANTPTKSYKDLRSYSDHQQQVITVSKQPGNNLVKSQNEVHSDKKYNLDYAWLDEKFKLVDQINPQSLKNVKTGSANYWADSYLFDEKEFKKFSDLDEGADSDSSSDLFELPNYDLDCFSNGLPVYETTNMDSIKKIAPISSAAR